MTSSKIFAPNMNFWDEQPLKPSREDYKEPLTPFKPVQNKAPLGLRSFASRNLFGTPVDQAPRGVESKKDSRFYTLYTRLENKGTVYYKNAVRKVQHLDNGSYFSVYQFTKTPGLLIKAYHGRTDYTFDAKKLRELLSHSLQSYRAVKKLGLPVAQIENITRAVKQGFFVQRKIVYPIDPRSDAQIRKVQKFFAAAVQNNVLMDLQPENLRVTKTGTVTLIDFVEEPEELPLLITKACRAWVSLCKNSSLNLDQSRAILNCLTSTFVNSHPNYSPGWLENILMT